MSRFAIPAIESATGATADIHARVKKLAGTRVPKTFAAAGYFGQAPLAGLPTRKAFKTLNDKSSA
jgi:hypothetical protein